MAVLHAAARHRRPTRAVRAARQEGQPRTLSTSIRSTRADSSRSPGTSRAGTAVMSRSAPLAPGDENTTCRVLETATGEWLADEIAGASIPSTGSTTAGSSSSAGRGRGQPLFRADRIHRLGRPSAEDPVLFEQYTEGPLATTWGPTPIVDDARPLAHRRVLHGYRFERPVVLRPREWRKSGTLERRDLSSARTRSRRASSTTIVFYASDDEGASNKRVWCSISRRGAGSISRADWMRGRTQ